MASQSECFGLDNPDTLYNLAMECVVNSLNMVTERMPGTSTLKFKDPIVLPHGICDGFLAAYQRKGLVDDNLVNIYRDRRRTHLTEVKLRNSQVTDGGLLIMLEHKPRVIELDQCDRLTRESLKNINDHCEFLVSLKIGSFTNIFPQEDVLYSNRGCILNAPNLKKLTVRLRGDSLFPLRLLTGLTHLDLSDCSSLRHVSYFTEMKQLKVLILYNVYWVQDVIEWILSIQTLEHLDVSQSNDLYGKYFNPNEVLANIIKKLPLLRALDISGTNLAGSGVAQHFPDLKCDIPGLSSRVGQPLEFLGLYGTLHGACRRHDIPALLISGDANESQVLTAAVTYIDRPEILTRVLNDLYHMFRNDNNHEIIRTLNIVLEAMEKHLIEKHIQISGSATIFYIVKGKNKVKIGIGMKKRIIKSLLMGMEAHISDETMMRNGCLTLCQFKIPADVIFQYERIVQILLYRVADEDQEGFVQRISIYLLNSLACQVDGKQKRFLGNSGAIRKMMQLIEDRLNRHLCDDVLEVAWSTLWNVTDETPENSERFLDALGMEYFLACLRSFPDKEELLRNMMGLLGNVAEVQHLRHYLMTPLFLNVFYDLLNSSSDGIEVSYNATGVLAHIASDGAEAWTVVNPSRKVVLARIATVIERWDLQAERNINYRSFEPIINLLKVHHTPQCQHWAVWALANLTSVYPDKYCSLVESEGGVELLRALVSHPEPYARIKDLAAQVLHNCHNYKQPQDAANDLSRPSSPEY